MTLGVPAMPMATEIVEPGVINEEITVGCIQVEGAAEVLEEKRRQLEFKEVESLIYSFKNLKKIDYLKPFHTLTKLQLDNNVISKIENLDHLVHLTWLDLSFNNIKKIEGLSKLSKLTDLSLYNNAITTIENLEALTALTVLSMGNNKIDVLENLIYLRQFKGLRLINFAGNPISKKPDYRPYILSHIKNLKYLDYRLVNKDQVTAAREQYQDEMLELEEKEEQEEAKEKGDSEKRVHNALMAEANMPGVEDLFENMLKEDPEFSKLRYIPSKDQPQLTDGIGEFRDKFTQFTDEFKTVMLEQHEKKTRERRIWDEVKDMALSSKDGEAQALITAFDKLKKHTFRGLHEPENLSSAEANLRDLHEKNAELHDKLMEFEMQIVDIVADLVQEFDRNYSEIVDVNKGHISSYFTQIRELEDAYFESTTANAMSLLEKFASGELDDVVSEEARAVLQDKDTLLNAIQASHDAHTTKIDGLEDKLGNGEVKRLNDLIAGLKQWESKRNRDRVAEIHALHGRNRDDVDKVLEAEVHEES